MIIEPEVIVEGLIEALQKHDPEMEVFVEKFSKDGFHHPHLVNDLRLVSLSESDKGTPILLVAREGNDLGILLETFCINEWIDD